MYNCEENCIEWLTNEDVVSVTFSQRKFKNKIKKLAEKYPDEVKIIAENKDGSIFAHIPLSWIKISRPKEVSEKSKERFIANCLRGLSETPEPSSEFDTDFDEIEDEP